MEFGAPLLALLAFAAIALAMALFALKTRLELSLAKHASPTGHPNGQVPTHLPLAGSQNWVAVHCTLQHLSATQVWLPLSQRVHLSEQPKCSQP